MNKGNLKLDGKSPTGDSHMTVVPFATDDGVPKVVLFVRTDVASSYEATLDGHPAIAIFFGEEQNGTGNAPWELGHLMAQQWEEAQKLAKTKKP